jgi:hypothetical protein
MSDTIDEAEVAKKVEDQFATFSDAVKKRVTERIRLKVGFRPNKTVDDALVSEAFQEEIFGYHDPRPLRMWRDGLLASINASVVLSATLAIAFGILATVGGDKTAASFLDISKIFAGAIVGAAGATTISRKSSS